MNAARILVVDDDPWIQRTAASILGQRGHQVSLAGDGTGALAVASRVRPDLIFTTLSIPTIDGWSWWERLRAIPACAGTPFVFLLSDPTGSSAEIPGALPQDHRLRKPFRVEDLERIVVRVLGGDPSEVPTSQTLQGMPALPSRPPRAVDPTKPSAGYRPLSALRGELDKIGLSSVLMILEMERQSGIVLVEHTEHSARLFLRKGRVIRAEAETPQLTGALAVYEVLGWTAGSFDFLSGDVGGIDEIQASTTFLLMEGARRADESKEQRTIRIVGDKL